MNDLAADDRLPLSTNSPKPTFHRLLFGDDGLRAGWSLLLYLLLAALFIFSGKSLVHHLLPHPNLNSAAPQELVPKSAVLGPGLAFASLALAALVMSLLERRPFSRYGLTLRRMPSDLVLGLCWGLLALSLLIATLFLTHTIAFDSVALHGTLALTFAAKWAAVFLLVGLFEEFLFRGYLQYTVSRGVAGLTRALDPLNRHSHLIGFCVAAFLFSVVFFTVAHLGNQGETAEGILSVALAGSVFAFSLYRTGSLVGNRLPHRVGLGPVLLLWHTRLRHARPRPSPRHPSSGSNPSLRRFHRP